MTPQALALVLAAAVCHATWNLLAKKAGGSGNHSVLLTSLLTSLLTVTLWAPLGGLAGALAVGGGRVPHRRWAAPAAPGA